MKKHFKNKEWRNVEKLPVEFPIGGNPIKIMFCLDQIVWIRQDNKKEALYELNLN